MDHLQGRPAPPPADVLVEARRHLAQVQRLGLPRDVVMQLMGLHAGDDMHRSMMGADETMRGNDGQNDVVMTDATWTMPQMMPPAATSAPMLGMGVGAGAMAGTSPGATPTHGVGAGFGAGVARGGVAGDAPSDTILEDASTRALFHGLPGPFQPWTHRARVSVSSTSSGSSGHASIWSTGSGASNASMATQFSQSALSSPLPAQPQQQSSAMSTPSPQRQPMLASPSVQQQQQQQQHQHQFQVQTPQQQQPAAVQAQPVNTSAAASSQQPQKAQQQPQQKQQQQQQQREQLQQQQQQQQASAQGPKYWCTSCDTSFKRKYDWKRHEEEFHERWKKYPCPEPGCNRSFWGSNTFNQHHKASHGCRTCPHSDKVVKYLRKRKFWACGFCSALHPSRERHVEHVARHFEAGKVKADWFHSRVIYGLLHQPLIHEAWKGLLATRQREYPGRQPRFSWNPSRTGRQQGFMESESMGQLQDLLEFFSGSEADAQVIVHLAYSLSDIVFMEGPPSPMSPGDFTDLDSAGMPPPYMSGPALNMPPPSHPPPPPPVQAQPAQVQSQRQSQASSQFLAPENTSAPPMSTQAASFAPTPSMVPAPLFGAPAQGQVSAPQVPQRSNTIRRASLDRELPPPPPPSEPSVSFDYLPNTQVFEDWQSLGSTIVEEPTPTDAMAPHGQGLPEWHMIPYFGHSVAQ